MVGIPGHHSPEHRFFCARTANRRRSTMNDQDLILWKKLQQKWLSRRSLIRGAAGTSAAAGLLLGCCLRSSVQADDDSCKALSRLIPNITSPPDGNFFFPGPPDVSASSTFPHFR